MLYVQSWRNLSYLENELDILNAQEQEKIAENDRQLKHMQKKLREEELRILRGQAAVDEKALDDALMQTNRNLQRPTASAAGPCPVSCSAQSCSPTLRVSLCG